jgi:hypothetical protein
MPDLDQTTYRATIDYGLTASEYARKTCACSNCSWKGFLRQLVKIGDCVLTPGDPSPAGRCPKCDSLAYVDEPIEDVEDVEIIDRESLGDAERVKFDPLFDWLAVHADGSILAFESDEFACAYQRAWRRANGMNPLTGERSNG